MYIKNLDLHSAYIHLHSCTIMCIYQIIDIKFSSVLTGLGQFSTELSVPLGRRFFQWSVVNGFYTCCNASLQIGPLFSNSVHGNPSYIHNTLEVNIESDLLSCRKRLGLSQGLFWLCVVWRVQQVQW